MPTDQPIYVIMDPKAYAQPQPRNGGSVLIKLAIVAGIGYCIYRIHEETERRNREAAEASVRKYQEYKNTVKNA